MHLINFKEVSGGELNRLVNLGIEVKANPEKYFEKLRGKSAALIFQKLQLELGFLLRLL